MLNFAEFLAPGSGVNLSAVKKRTNVHISSLRFPLLIEFRVRSSNRPPLPPTNENGTGNINALLETLAHLFTKPCSTLPGNNDAGY